MSQGKEGIGGSKLRVKMERRGGGEGRAGRIQELDVTNAATHARDFGMMSQVAQVRGKYETLV